MISTRKAAMLDNIGITASTLCAIHCAAVPVFFTSLPLFGLGFLANPWVEWVMILTALLIGVWAIGGAYIRVHRRALPLMLLIAGFVAIIAGHLFLTGWAETIVVPLGGLTIAVAHFINYKYAGTCRAANSIFHVKHTHTNNNQAA